MHKLKLYLLTALCALAVGGLTQTPAQTSGDKVLVAGKQPLRRSEVSTMIEFYEWAFETTFTDDERDRFTELSVEAFRQDPAASRKNADALIKVFQQVQAKDASTQSRMRTIFNEDFVKELHTSSDPASSLLLGVYERSHGDNATAASSAVEPAVDTADTGSSKAAGSLAAIAGKWAWGRSGSTTKTVTGVYLGGNASRFTYEFSPNGTVAFTGIMTVMTGGCKLTAFSTKKGRATLSGGRLTINWAPTAFSRDDTCSPAKNYKKTLPAETEVFSVAMKDSYGQRQLCLTGKDETCFSPEN